MAILAGADRHHDGTPLERAGQAACASSSAGGLEAPQHEVKIYPRLCGHVTPGARRCTEAPSQRS